MPYLRFYIITLSLLITSLASGQGVLDTPIKPAMYSGNLGSYLDLLSTQCSVSFSYKSRVVKKKNVVVNKKIVTLSAALRQIKNQCELDFNVVSENAITLYPTKGTYIFGTLFNSKSSERVSDAIIQYSYNEYITTDKDGNFRIHTLQDSLSLTIYHPNYQVVRRTVRADKSVQYFIKLAPVAILKEISVVTTDESSESFNTFEEVKPSIRNILSVGGETDALAYIKQMPGVQNISFGQQGLTVRGGSPDQNYTLLDGMPVYNSYHLLGLFSIFSSSSINSIRLHKDAFPSKYSSRLSSVIDVSLKNGNKQKASVEADIGILSSGIHLSGPIVKDKLSFNISVRRTYADLLAWPAQQISNPGNTTSLWSFDLTGKVHWQINDRNDLSITGYNGGDQLSFKTKLNFIDETIIEESSNGSLGWRNEVLGARYTGKIGSRAVLRLDASSSNYQLRFADEYNLILDSSATLTSSLYRNGLREQRIGLDMDVQWAKNNMLQVGVGLVKYIFSPFERGYQKTTPIGFIDTSLVSRELLSDERFAYFENITYFKGGNITVGLRYSSFATGASIYNRFQPKLNLIQNLSNRQQLRFGMTVSNQFVHLVPNNNLGLPVDIWLPVTPNLKPMGMTQFSTRYILKHKYWSAESGLFSKFYANILEHESGTQLLTQENWEDNLKSGTGRVFGVELAGNLEKNNWRLYTSYTFSKSLRTIQGINNDFEYASKYDRPHVINVLGEYRVNTKWEFTAAWSYASGNPITVPEARYVTLINNKQVVVEEYGDINNYRLPSTHHLDLTFVKKRTHKKFKSTFTFGVYNVYNRLNPFMAFIGLDEDAMPQLKLRSYLPILPTLKYSVTL